jgi:precorrin-6x reductase
VLAQTLLEAGFRSVIATVTREEARTNLFGLLQNAISVRVRGFTQAHILALRPPFSKAFNRSLLEEYRADVLVTKASGADGGVVGKVSVSTISAAIDACCQALVATD